MMVMITGTWTSAVEQLACEGVAKLEEGDDSRGSDCTCVETPTVSAVLPVGNTTVPGKRKYNSMGPITVVKGSSVVWCCQSFTKKK